MVLFPEIQAKAREEVDRVVGPSRLPEWTDRPDMPIVRRCVDETLRCSSCCYLVIQTI